MDRQVRPGACARRFPIFAIAMVSCLAGCIKVKDHLTLRADGSGTVRIEVESAAPLEAAVTMRERRPEGGTPVGYPPMTKDDAQALFPGDGFTITAGAPTQEKGYWRFTVDVAFRDINDLTGSPYGRARSLAATVQGGTLNVTALSGLEAAMLYVRSEAEAWAGWMLNVTDLRKKEGEARAEFKITLPSRIDSSNGKVEDSTAAWTMDRSTLDRALKTDGVLAERMTAACRAEGIEFVPVPRACLALVPFKDLKAGPTGDVGNTPSEKEVVAAARFVPCVLQTMRSFDLAGDRVGETSGALLSGLMLIPRPLAPQERGGVEVLKVADDAGNDLRLAGKRQHVGGLGEFGVYPHAGDGKQENAGKEMRYHVLFGFKAPDRDVKKIARIEAAVDFRYFRESQIVKLEHVVPAEWIGDGSEGGARTRGQRALRSEALMEVGLSADLHEAAHRSDITRLALTVRPLRPAQPGVAGAHGGVRLADVQVFDAEGVPRQCFPSISGDAQNIWCSIHIPGSPKAPLSLAFLLNSYGKPIKVPIVLENVPLSEPAKAAEPPKEK